MEVLNSMISAAIVESFCLITGYFNYIILLDIEKRKRKYVFVVVFMKIFVFNMIMAYIKNLGIDELSLNRITIFANVIAVIAMTAALKIISDREYMKIFLSNLIADAA